MLRFEKRSAAAELRRDRFGLVMLVLLPAAAIPIVPDWPHRHPFDPAYLATMSFVVCLLSILGLRACGRRGSRLERALLALLLASMPLVYLAGLMVSPARGHWLAIELAGAVLYAGAAWLGVTRSPWFLAGGMLAHGLLWDLPHCGTAGFVPNWYALGCFLADVGLSCYVATQASAYAVSARRALAARRSELQPPCQ